MISVLIPTRKRVPQLRRSLKTLLGTYGGSLDDLEILIRADIDDVQTIDFLKYDYDVQKHNSVIRYVLGPRKKGYASIHEFFYELYEFSCGETLLLYNDDSIMLTKNWDRELTNNANKFWIKKLICKDTPKDSVLYFAISRNIIDALGHFGESFYVDGWAWCVFRNYITEALIHVIHNRDVQKNDITAFESESYKKNFAPSFYGWKLTLSRVRDRQVFLNLYNGHYWPISILLISEFMEKIRILRYLKRKIRKII